MPSTSPIGRPASCGLRGACLRPGPIRGRMGRASCPPRGRLTPHKSMGGVRRPRADLWSPLRGPRVGFAPPPRPPGPRGGAGGGCGATRASPSMPRGIGPPRAMPAPAFGRAALTRPFRRRPRPARVPSPPLRRIGLDATRRRPAPRRASTRVRPRVPGVSVPGRSAAGPRPRPPPARAAARPPCRSVRGLQRAASMRPVRLIIHIFTVPEIPYFTGFSSRQAR